jgi:hypothetical protein
LFLYQPCFLSDFNPYEIKHKTTKKTSHSDATSLLSLPLFALSLFITTARTSPCCTTVNATTYHAQFVNKWLEFRDGNASLLDELAAPDMVMFMNCAPSSTSNSSDFFPITPSQGLAQAMRFAFEPYES